MGLLSALDLMAVGVGAVIIVVVGVAGVGAVAVDVGANRVESMVHVGVY